MSDAGVACGPPDCVLCHLSDNGGLGTVQEAFCATHALQCGYCTPGMVLASQALLDRNRRPTRADIDDALGGNICRCTGYVQIREAVELAARQYQAQEAGAID